MPWEEELEKFDKLLIDSKAAAHRPLEFAVEHTFALNTNEANFCTLIYFESFWDPEITPPGQDAINALANIKEIWQIQN